MLIYLNHKPAVVEAKRRDLPVSEGVAQAKAYAKKLAVRFTYVTNGIAINNVLEAVAAGKERILLTLATGTGKTAIAFQIAWKLFHSRWNLQRDVGDDMARRSHILFLADRNILADQAYNAFSAFEDQITGSLVRISPMDIRQHGRVPTNGSVFFTIFQTFMSGPPKDGKPSPYFVDYPADFFDFIVIDECQPVKNQQRPGLLRAGDSQRRRTRRSISTRVSGQRKIDPDHPHDFTETFYRRGCA